MAIKRRKSLMDVPLEDTPSFRNLSILDTLLQGISIRRLVGQQIKLIQLACTSELHENQQNDLVFFKIIPSHFCRASEASEIDCFKN